MNHLAIFLRKPLLQDFCLPELVSVCQMFNAPITYDSNFSHNIDVDPCVRIHIPNIQNYAENICSRAVLVKSIIELYSTGKSYEELIKNINKEKFTAEENSLESFKFEIDARGKSLSVSEKNNVINYFHFFDFKAKVDLKNPKRTFVILDNSFSGNIYFGKLIAGKDEDARYYSKFNLQERKYLGPTTTDNVLAFIMCNLAQVLKNYAVYDPFCGTGSLLIPPAYFNAITFGSDIDLRVLKGYCIGYMPKSSKIEIVKTKKGNIFTNFITYNLNPPQIIRQDINNPFFVKREFLDCIICDPPYGHRAFTRKVGVDDSKKIRRQERIQNKKKKDEQMVDLDSSSSSEEQINNTTEIKQSDETVSQTPNNINFAQLRHCTVEQIFDNLLKLGSDIIRPGGYLVCLYPTKKKREEQDLLHLPINFPQNENFKLLHSIENAYSSRKSRWCLVYRKI